MLVLLIKLYKINFTGPDKSYNLDSGTAVAYAPLSTPWKTNDNL
jgi:hypothetical protein